MIIFLDMDGVLNTTRVCLSKRREDSYNMFGWIDPIAVGLIDRWAEAAAEKLNTTTKIVLSTTWRSEVETRHVANIIGGLLGLSCMFHEEHCTGREGNCRGDEIAAWLQRHPEETNYIIVDDDGDFLEEQKEFHIHTNTYDGILFKNHLEFEEILEGMLQ